MQWNLYGPGKVKEIYHSREKATKIKKPCERVTKFTNFQEKCRKRILIIKLRIWNCSSMFTSFDLGCWSRMSSHLENLDNLEKPVKFMQTGKTRKICHSWGKVRKICPSRGKVREIYHFSGKVREIWKFWERVTKITNFQEKCRKKILIIKLRIWNRSAMFAWFDSGCWSKVPSHLENPDNFEKPVKFMRIGKVREIYHSREEVRKIKNLQERVTKIINFKEKCRKKFLL